MIWVNRPHHPTCLRGRMAHLPQETHTGLPVRSSSSAGDRGMRAKCSPVPTGLRPSGLHCGFLSQPGFYRAVSLDLSFTYVTVLLEVAFSLEMVCRTVFLADFSLMGHGLALFPCRSHWLESCWPIFCRVLPLGLFLPGASLGLVSAGRASRRKWLQPGVVYAWVVPPEVVQAGVYLP